MTTRAHLRLVGPHAPSVPGSATSEAAAAAIEPVAGTLRAKVLDAIRASREIGMTDEEIGVALGMPGNTVRPRRRELENAGSIVPSIDTRPTRSGRRAVVWVAAEFSAREPGRTARAAGRMMTASERRAALEALRSVYPMAPEPQKRALLVLGRWLAGCL